MKIILDDVTGGEIRAFLAMHIAESRNLAPPGSAHVLDIDALQKPDVTFWSMWEGDRLLGCGALKELSNTHAEVKSMRVTTAEKKRGLGTAILAHLINEARTRGYKRLSLETGSYDFFIPARALYEKLGFTYCPPFANYTLDPYSLFMTKELSTQ